MQQITDPKEAKAQRFRNSEWGPEATESMIAAVRDFPTTFGGGVLGDIIDATPKDVISKVMLEEKVFETWHHKRVELIGDGILLHAYLMLVIYNRQLKDAISINAFLTFTIRYYHR